MGAWGTGVFSNDTAADLKHDFRQLVAGGRTATEATEQLVEEYCVESGNADDHDFWLGLASVQHDTGHVVPEVVDRARRIIDDPAEIARWSPSDRRARARVLARLADRLATAPPPPRRLRLRVLNDTALVPGQHVVVPAGAAGPVLLRITGIHEDMGGQYPRAIAVQWDGRDRSLRKAHRLPPMIDPNRSHLREGSARSRDGEALGFLLTTADPPGLRLLPVTSNRRTPEHPWSSSWAIPWSDLSRWFRDSRTPAPLGDG